jgi:hypothetical protein
MLALRWLWVAKVAPHGMLLKARKGHIRGLVFHADYRSATYRSAPGLRGASPLLRRYCAATSLSRLCLGREDHVTQERGRLARRTPRTAFTWIACCPCRGIHILVRRPQMRLAWKAQEAESVMVNVGCPDPDPTPSRASATTQEAIRLSASPNRSISSRVL